MASDTTPAPAGEAGLLVEPEVRRAVNGGLRTTLRARYAYKEIGGHKLHVRTYEGTVPGPTLRCRPGDVLAIRLINDLPPNRDVNPLNTSPPAPFQYDELSFSRLARESRRHRRQRHAQHGARKELRRRDRPAARRPYPRHLLVSPTPSRRGRHPDGQRDGGRADRRGGFRRRSGDRARPGAHAGAEPGGVRRPGDCGGVRHALSGNGHALLLDQRAADAHDRDASGRGAALAPAARRLSGHPPGRRWSATRCTRLPTTGSPSPVWSSQEAMVLAPGQRADVLVQAGAPGDLCAAAACLRFGLSRSDRADGPRHRGGRAAADERFRPRCPRRPCRSSAMRSSPAHGGSRSRDSPRGRGGRTLAGVQLHGRRPTIRSPSDRPACPPRGRGGVDRDESPRARPRLPHSHQPVSGDQDQRPARAKARLARYRGRAAGGAA